MTIIDLRTYVVDVFRTNLVLIEVETSDGIVGSGEATLEYKEHAIVGALDDLRDELVGRDPHDVRAIVEDSIRDSYWRTGPVLTSALSAVEMALLDVNGKELGVPVHRLLGGRVHASVPVYANGWFAGARTPEDFARAARDAVGRGFRGLKFDPFGTAHRTIDTAALDGALGRIDAVRTAIGSEVDLLVEGHGRFSVAAARTVAREIAPYRPLWFEEPVPPGDAGALADVRRLGVVAVAAGERLYSRRAFIELLNAGAVDYVQPDVSHVGGIAEVARIAAIAEAFEVGIAPHNPSGPVATAATLQLAASLPNFVYLETMATDVPWRSRLSTERLTFDAGRMLIGDAPGLGVELHTGAFAEHPFVRHKLRHYDGTLTDIRPPESSQYF